MSNTSHITTVCVRGHAGHPCVATTTATTPPTTITTDNHRPAATADDDHRHPADDHHPDADPPTGAMVVVTATAETSAALLLTTIANNAERPGTDPGPKLLLNRWLRLEYRNRYPLMFRLRHVALHPLHELRVEVNGATGLKGGQYLIQFIIGYPQLPLIGLPGP